MKKLNLLFIVSKSRIRKDGKAPLFCRLTYLEKRKQFSTGLFINPKNWNNSLQECEPPNNDNNYINSQLNLIKNQINQVFLYLQINNSEFTVDDIYTKFKGNTPKKEFGVLEVYELFNIRILKLIGRDLQKVTYKKYIESFVHLKSFIKAYYKANDIKLKDLKLNFLNEYEYFLKTQKGLEQSTINKAIQRFRKVIQFALEQEYIDKNPFIGYKAKRLQKEVIYLSDDELKSLENYDFSQTRLQQVKDLFVFCCYTGLAFKEMSNLKPEHIVNGFDGNKWIKMNREKTSKPLMIPLLPKALDMINKYQNEEILLPVISNQRFNSYLKEIADIVGLKKNLTHHIARKTFASTVLLFNDVPMEIVSELLGHSKLSTTQDYYAKIVNKKVSEQMSRLSLKITSKNEFNDKG
ncbi:site-specific integrase [Flavobacterium sp. HXWNR69]|uniref:Site-specific integrase n=1 Tax=Flavobacterium fragile TaxID=2949085 RepID=A0ABT0TD92_9FLAO|nr:site-specific integrase [Flavobacterium sp. HXWNR69]MCL9768882.1 site-specific integrase [Flavobacterium sp. HXWNR69]